MMIGEAYQRTTGQFWTSQYVHRRHMSWTHPDCGYADGMKQILSSDIPELWISIAQEERSASKRTYSITVPSQIKHQLDARLCRFYFCRVTLHVTGVKRPSSGVFKTGTAAIGTCVIVAGRSSHHLIRALLGPNKVMWWHTYYDARKHKIKIKTL
jgi:hypothetical protein